MTLSYWGYNYSREAAQLAKNPNKNIRLFLAGGQVTHWYYSSWRDLLLGVRQEVLRLSVVRAAAWRVS